LIGEGVPVALLVKELSRELSRRVGGSIIEDKTGLTGNYDFMLQWTPEESGPSIFRGSDRTSAPESSGPSLFTALQEQVGLKLELKNGPGEILVIDHVERPSDPQAQNTYARAPVFQVVPIEPNKSSNPMRAITAGADELKITNFTLRMLILRAYGVQGYQLSGGADWLDPPQEDLGRTVRNKTGLAGHYDFTLQWTPGARKGPADDRQAKFNDYSEFFSAPPKNNLNTGRQVGLPDSSGTSIFLAIQEQLGLKLEPQTTPLEFLVIDHAEKPSEN